MSAPSCLPLNLMFHVVSQHFTQLFGISQVSKSIVCPGQKSECPEGNTCCEMEGGGYGCCPMPNVCCLFTSWRSISGILFYAENRYLDFFGNVFRQLVVPIKPTVVLTTSVAAHHNLDSAHRKRKWRQPWPRLKHSRRCHLKVRYDVQFLQTYFIQAKYHIYVKSLGFLEYKTASTIPWASKIPGTQWLKNFYDVNVR